MPTSAKWKVPNWKSVNARAFTRIYSAFPVQTALVGELAQTESIGIRTWWCRVHQYASLAWVAPVRECCFASLLRQGADLLSEFVIGQGIVLSAVSQFESRE
jgi:hypothetical protein